MWEVYPIAWNIGYQGSIMCVCAARVEGTHTPALLLLSFQQEQETKESTQIATIS